jgi:hypothetical protein
VGVGIGLARAALTVVAAVAVSGCGGGGDAADSTAVPASPAEAGAAVHRAAAQLRSSGSVRFDSKVVRVRADRPTAETKLMSASGTVDLDADRGRMNVDLSPLFAGAPAGTPNPFARPVELRWTPNSLEARYDGDRKKLTRANARKNGGLVGRLPDEPAALIGALASSREVRDLGSATVAGDGTRRYAFTIQGDVGRRLAALAALVGSSGADKVPLPSMQVWIGDDGTARRLAYVVDLPRVRATSGDFLPRRTVTATYDLSG